LTPNAEGIKEKRGKCYTKDRSRSCFLKKHTYRKGGFPENGQKRERERGGRLKGYKKPSSLQERRETINVAIRLEGKGVTMAGGRQNTSKRTVEKKENSDERWEREKLGGVFHCVGRENNSGN